MERAQWLRLVHSNDPRIREWHHHLQRRDPGAVPGDREPEAVLRFLSRLAGHATCDQRAVDADLRWLAAADNRHLLPITDPRYPAPLLQIHDPPLAVFAHGDPACLSRPCVAIVGSRAATPQGRDTAERLGRTLAGLGLTVVSGLARGIDGCAHRGALDAGATAAVCANGLDTVYPRRHRELAERIALSGVLLSEFATGTPPRRSHFPQRNRLISGLSLGTIVVEAGLQSGSLITARLALEQNREVFAVPGSIHSPQSRGCHDLIRNGATLVETPEDVVREMPPVFHHTRPTKDPGCAAARGEHAWFLDHMGYAPCTPDELVRRSGLTTGEVSSMLLMLELEGCVELCPGGTYVRVTRS